MNLKSTFFNAFVIMAIASIIAVEPSSAQPAAPEFTAVSDGSTLTISIKNPEFTPHEENGSKISLYYLVRHLGEGDATWRETHLPGQPDPAQLGQTYTVLEFTALHYPSGSKIDVQVQALVGSMYLVDARLIGGSDFYVFNGERGNWSNSQTITVSGQINPTVPPYSSPSNQNPSPTTSNPQNPTPKSAERYDMLSNFDWQTTVLLIMATMIAGLTIAVALLWRKVANKQN